MAADAKARQHAHQHHGQNSRRQGQKQRQGCGARRQHFAVRSADARRLPARRARHPPRPRSHVHANRLVYMSATAKIEIYKYLNRLHESRASRISHTFQRRNGIRRLSGRLSGMFSFLFLMFYSQTYAISLCPHAKVLGVYGMPPWGVLTSFADPTAKWIATNAGDSTYYIKYSSPQASSVVGKLHVTGNGI